MASKIHILMVGIFKIQITGERIEGLNDLCVGKEYTRDSEGLTLVA